MIIGAASRFMVALVFLVAFLCCPSRAQHNLVVNGGFEALTAAWQGQYGLVQPPRLPSVWLKEGRVSGGILDVRTMGNQPMSQRLSTEPLIPYVLEFSLLSGRPVSGGPPPLPVTVFWGTKRLGDFLNPSETEWQTYRVNVTAQYESTELRFVNLGPTWQLIDEISVTAIPEPTSLSLVIVALMAMFTYKCKRSRFATPLQSSSTFSSEFPFPSPASPTARSITLPTNGRKHRK